LGKRKLKRDE